MVFEESDATDAADRLRSSQTHIVLDARSKLFVGADHYLNINKTVNFNCTDANNDGSCMFSNSFQNVIMYRIRVIPIPDRFH